MAAATGLTAAVAVLRKAIEYARRDQAAAYSLPGDVSVTIRSRSVAGFPQPDFTSYTTRDGSLTVERLDERTTRLTAHPFPAESKLWNGPDVIPNKWFRSMLASLFHDLIWVHGEELAGAMGQTTVRTLRWGGDVLYLVWRAASEGSPVGRCEAWLAFQSTQWAAPWYHRLKDLLGALLVMSAILAAAGCSDGCYSPPDGEVLEIGGADVIHSVMQTQGDGLGK